MLPDPEDYFNISCFSGNLLSSGGGIILNIIFNTNQNRKPLLSVTNYFHPAQYEIVLEIISETKVSKLVVFNPGTSSS